MSKNLDYFPKMLYDIMRKPAGCLFGVGHGRTSRGDSGALYLQSATAGMNPGPRRPLVSLVASKR